MSTLLPIHASYAETLLEVHWAAQIPAAASRQIEAEADWSHTNLLVEGGVLRGRPLIDARRVELDVATLALRLGDAELALEGRTLDGALAWLGERLGGRLEPLDHGLPERPKDKPFAHGGAEAQLLAWFELAQRRLSDVAAGFGGGEVRVWPHHFDIATLIELDPGGGEEARSVNAGLSPGDGSYSTPYWYVTPWPKPSGALPKLPAGHWHTEGFTAAVLTAVEAAPTDVEAQAARFLEQSAALCRELLE